MSISQEKLDSLKESFDSQLSEVSELAGIENLKIQYLGRKGELSVLLRSVKDLPAEERGVLGKAANELRQHINNSLMKKASGFTASQDFFDVTEPSQKAGYGHLNPLSLVFEEVSAIFTSMGFDVLEGNHVTTDYYNFESLNIPKGHPARDAWDTFYLKQKPKDSDDLLLLRPHTTAMQHELMRDNDPPLRKIMMGRCFRNEATDATHEHTFHQIDGIVVDDSISVTHLVFILKVFLTSLFKESIEVRLRPGFFPFVEPGYELDFQCLNCKGEGCRICKYSGWVEFLGCGMIHPKVFDEVGFERKKYTGLAFGMGLDRITMMKYRIDDIRLLHSGDLRFTRQF